MPTTKRSRPSKTQRKSSSNSTTTTQKVRSTTKSAKSTKSTTTSTTLYPIQTYNTWKATLQTPSSFAKLSQKGQVMMMPQKFSGVVFVVKDHWDDFLVDSAPPPQTTRRRMRYPRKHLPGVYSMSLPPVSDNGGYPPSSVTMREGDLLACRLNGAFALRKSRLDTLPPPEYSTTTKLTKTNLAKTAKTLLEQYDTAFAKAMQCTPEHTTSGSPVVLPQMKQWLENLLSLAKTGSKTAKPIFIDIVHLPDSTNESSQRPHNTCLMVRYEDIASVLPPANNACYVTVSRTECRKVTAKEAKTMYLALDVDRGGWGGGKRIQPCDVR